MSLHTSSEAGGVLRPATRSLHCKGVNHGRS